MTTLSRELSIELLGASTLEKIREWLAKVEDQISWLPVGGVSNNSLACDLASGPMPALIERVTNGMDAVLEDRMLLSRLAGRHHDPGSPREAARILLGIEDDMDSTPHAILHDAAKLLVVSMHEGTSQQTPTCVLRDRGVGQSPDRFPDTLLSICADNKTDKPWMHGRYNAGSSASYKFAGATVVVSRRNPQLLGDGPDEVGASVVLHVPGRRPGPCVYMADRDGRILRLDLPQFAHGTEVRLVDYQLPRHNAKAAHATHSLRQAFYSHFVRPSLPFCVSERRKRFLDRSGHQKIYGLYHALEGKLSVQKSSGLSARPNICAFKQNYKIPLAKLGSATLRCFVLHEDAKQGYYVPADQAFCFSLNGQRQHSRERYWFRELGYNNIFQRMVCVVECDDVNYNERHSIFTSNREGVVDSPNLRKIMLEVERILRDDPDLRQLEEQAKEEKIKNSSGKVGEKTIDQIKRIIGGLNIKGSGTQGNFAGRKTPPAGRKRSTSDSHLPHLPTRLDIEKDPLKASRGSRLRVYVELGCKNGYLPAPGREIGLKSDALEVASVSGTLGGCVRFDVKVKDDATLGEHEVLVVLMDRDNDILLSDEAKIEVSEPRTGDHEEEKKKKPDHGGADRNVEVHWVTRDSWEIHGWDGESVGECQEEPDGSVTFFLNRNNRNLDEAAENGDFTEDSWERFLERCSLPLCAALHAILNDETPADPRRTENEKERTLQAVLLSIRPELVPDNAPGKHSVPKVRNEDGTPAETARKPLRQAAAQQRQPGRDIRNLASFQKEMKAAGY